MTGTPTVHCDHTKQSNFLYPSVSNREAGKKNFSQELFDPTVPKYISKWAGDLLLVYF